MPFPTALRLSLFSLLLLVLASDASAQSAGAEEGDLPIYYAVGRQATIFSTPDSTQPYVQLRFREPVYLLEEVDGWCRVRTQDGAVGFVAGRALSNVWLRVSKRKKAVYAYRGTELMMKMPADFGYNAFADKEKRGSLSDPDHWRTPEGVFFIVRKNPRSTFYKAFVLNYPTAEDAERGRQDGLISEAEYAAIVRAEETFSMPPMHTALGGMIEIHGDGTGVGTNWTQGCIAIQDGHIDQLWDVVEVGTPVLVEP